jgi:hypothetical protein
MLKLYVNFSLGQVSLYERFFSGPRVLMEKPSELRHSETRRRAQGASFPDLELPATLERQYRKKANGKS